MINFCLVRLLFFASWPRPESAISAERDLASGGLVTSVRCGGGHRSWDTAGTSLAYIKEGRVAVVAGALGPGRRRAVLGGGGSIFLVKAVIWTVSSPGPEQWRSVRSRSSQSLLRRS